MEKELLELGLTSEQAERVRELFEEALAEEVDAAAALHESEIDNLKAQFEVKTAEIKSQYEADLLAAAAVKGFVPAESADDGDFQISEESLKTMSVQEIADNWDCVERVLSANNI